MHDPGTLWSAEYKAGAKFFVCDVMPDDKYRTISIGKKGFVKQEHPYEWESWWDYYYGKGNVILSGPIPPPLEDIPDEIDIYVYCPVDVVVYTPNKGYVINKYDQTMEDSSYSEIDLDGDGNLDKVIHVPRGWYGDYEIYVRPQPGADPDETFLIDVVSEGETIHLVQDMKISDINEDKPFIYTKEEPEWRPIITGPTNGKINRAYEFYLDSTTLYGMGAYEYLIDWGDNSPNQLVTGPYEPGETVIVRHMLDEPGTYAVRVKVKDQLGQVSDWSPELTVQIVDTIPPEITSISLPVDPVAVNALVCLESMFIDESSLDMHSATIDWGDGNSTIGIVNESSQTVAGCWQYTRPGVYTVNLTVKDYFNLSDYELYQFVVVYDSDDGFVTGGSWINSPEGAYTENPTLSGKANFGFVAKYKKGQSAPTGNTEFQFKAGDLNFHSSDYDWLVIAGAKAMYKGIGTVNGAGNYGFMLSAIDEKLTPSTDVDIFRIKIWDKNNNDAIVYDNNMGSGEDADPTTEICGGQIVIHKK